MREIVYEGQARRDEPSVARNSESDSWLKQRGAKRCVLVEIVLRRLSLGLFWFLLAASSSRPTTTRSES